MTDEIKYCAKLGREENTIFSQPFFWHYKFIRHTKKMHKWNDLSEKHRNMWNEKFKKWYKKYGDDTEEVFQFPSNSTGGGIPTILEDVLASPQHGPSKETGEDQDNPKCASQELTHDGDNFEDLVYTSDFDEEETERKTLKLHSTESFAVLQLHQIKTIKKSLQQSSILTSPLSTSVVHVSSSIDKSLLNLCDIENDFLSSKQPSLQHNCSNSSSTSSVHTSSATNKNPINYSTVESETQNSKHYLQVRLERLDMNSLPKNCNYSTPSPLLPHQYIMATQDVENAIPNVLKLPSSLVMDCSKELDHHPLKNDAVKETIKVPDGKPNLDVDEAEFYDADLSRGKSCSSVFSEESVKSSSSSTECSKFDSCSLNSPRKRKKATGKLSKEARMFKKYPPSKFFYSPMGPILKNFIDPPCLEAMEDECNEGADVTKRGLL